MAASAKLAADSDSSFLDDTFASAGDITITSPNISIDTEDFEITATVDNMVNFEDENAEDGKDMHQKLYQLKLKREFDRNDLLFWFGQFESQLEEIGVKAQWTKRRALDRQLPQDVAEEVK